MEIKVNAQLRYLRLAPRKTRAVADIIRGLPVSEAEAQLMLSPRRPSAPLLKLLRSAVANAAHNFKLDPAKLYVKEIRVDQGPKSKRWMPRAKGGASPIEKKTSHVALTLGILEKPAVSRFTIVKPEKKEKAKKEKEVKKHEHEHEEKRRPTAEKEKPQAQRGIFKRIFRRKTV